MVAEQVSLIHPLIPLQVRPKLSQSSVTSLASPALHRLVVGAVVKLHPSALPHTPSIIGKWSAAQLTLLHPFSHSQSHVY